MKDLLEQEFISHYNSQKDKPVVFACQESTTDTDFELKDDLAMIYPIGSGVAKYKNPTQQVVFVINLEKFKNALPPRVKNNLGKGVCDLIVYTENHFLLNELTDTEAKYIDPFDNSKGKQEGKLAKAQRQLTTSLKDLLQVNAIKQYVQNFSFKQCCFFSQQAHTPSILNATIAFNRLSALSLNGFKLSSSDIESLGFEFWEYSGNQIYTFK